MSGKSYQFGSNDTLYEGVLYELIGKDDHSQLGVNLKRIITKGYHSGLIFVKYGLSLVLQLTRGYFVSRRQIIMSFQGDFKSFGPPTVYY